MRHRPSPSPPGPVPASQPSAFCRPPGPQVYTALLIPSAKSANGVPAWPFVTLSYGVGETCSRDVVFSQGSARQLGTQGPSVRTG